MAFLWFQIAYGEDQGIADKVSEAGQNVKEGADKVVTESKNFFEKFGDKVGEYYHKAVDSSKDALKATGDAISNSYNQLKEKTKELME